MAASDTLAFKAKMKTLIGFSLVETKQQERSYTIHPVVQNWCFHIAASDDYTVQLYELTLISVGHMAPSKEDRDYARLQQRFLPHANHLILNCPYNRIDVWEALDGLGNLYFSQDKLIEAEEMYQ
ncbi:uncharacterized protein BDW43DRAFT_258482 [Aspergillus alliaceus]|uniref:uncharacterized protein n=1 Tax=Petromyces alliaceus TaxID=209559 RepID=UPI0012A75A60|nr:uncharacterized protein BDW43DRAFT_258482 [Aspergillus alliaceus]KAB8239553.1 hypothetical protein BDW43DRAFT_258482 [Aspergillus alliaceus]